MTTFRTPMRWGLLALLASQVACTTLMVNYAPGARYEAIREFSKERSCPAERLAVQQVRLQPEDVLQARTPPPPEVAADPGRLAVWQKNADRDLNSFRKLTAVDVIGCDAHHTYFCWQEDDASGATIDGCDIVQLDRPDARLLNIYPIKPAARQQLLLQLQQMRQAGAAAH